MCARLKFTVPEQFTKGTRNMFGKSNTQVEARPGSTVPIITKKGNVGMALWDGFARIETLKKVWISKGWQPVKIINGTQFSERDTVSGTKELKEFQMTPGSGIAAVAKVVTGTNRKPSLEVKIVTEPAKGDVSKVHHRMPVILKMIGDNNGKREND